MSFEAFWNYLGAASFYTTVAPFLFGTGLAHLKPWLTTEEAVRDRCRIRREALAEQVNQALFSLLDKTLGLDVTKLRGAPPKEIDWVNSFTSQVFRVFRVQLALECIESTVRKIYSTLFATAAIALLCFLLALTIDSIRPYVALIGVCVLLSQIIAVALLRAATKRLADYETTT